MIYHGFVIGTTVLYVAVDNNKQQQNKQMHIFSEAFIIPGKFCEKNR
jgi:hypothetical protein